MKKTVIIALLTVLSISADAQWKKIAELEGTIPGGWLEGSFISAVYFLDLPGPIRIGYAGTNGQLWKTTNGGYTWTLSWPGNGYIASDNGVTGIAFKDSLTGWFSIFDGEGIGGICAYKTTDGGGTWNPIYFPGTIDGGEAIYYSPATNYLLLSMVVDTGMELSTDLGGTWKTVTNFVTGGISFSSDSMGIAEAYPTDTTVGLIRTTDGGLTWVLTDSSIGSLQPLAIPGTPICFASDLSRIIIRRSDDYGKTWRILKDFGPVYAYIDSEFKQIAPYGTGDIEGDLSRLYIQTDSGMFISTDQGVTWLHDKGPKGNGDGYPPTFYSGKGVTIAGWVDDRTGDMEGYGLWEEIWPQAGVTENETLDSSFFYIAGPYPNPSEPSGDNVSILVHYCSIGSVITAQVYTLLGSPVGSAVTYTSDGQVWDRLEIPAPGTSGPYYIQVSVGAYGTTLSYSVY